MQNNNNSIKISRVGELISLILTRPLSFREYLARIFYTSRMLFLKPLSIKYNNVISQKVLINSGNWDILIVLDACRYDAFKEIVYKYLKGKLVPTLSSGSITIDWFINTWCNLKHNRYIYYLSANPFIRRNDKNISRCVYKIVDVWRLFWNKELSTVDTKNALNFAKTLVKIHRKSIENGRLRIVVHLLSPHAPYLYWPKIFSKIWNLGAPYNISMLYSLYLGKKEAIINVLWESYLRNLEYAIQNIAIFIRDIEKISNKIKIVITSDHGELFGEYGLLFHTNINVPELRIVPWFIVSR